MRASSIAAIVETSSAAIVAPSGRCAPALVSREILLPHYCARCLADPDETYLYEQCDRLGSETTRSSVRVPICSACLRAVSGHRRRAVELFVHATVAGAILAALAWGLASWAVAAWLVSLGPVVGVMLYSLERNKAAVCALDAVAPYFENRQYQALFERLNGFDRSEYSPFARLNLDGVEPGDTP